MATHYCSDNEVARFLQVPHFTSSTFPLDSTVEEFINMAEERVDQLTDHVWHASRVSSTNGTVTEERGRIQRVMSNSVNDRGRIQLRHYPILAMQSGTDKLHVWDGGNYVEYIANKTGDDTITNVTGKDYWVDKERGTIYLNSYNQFNLLSDAPSGVTAYVTYRYATATPPQDIKLATTYFAAAMIAMNDDLNVMQEGDDSMDNATRSQRFEEMGMKVLKDNRRLGRAMPMSRAIGGFGARGVLP
tara:strand:+ start:54 stop:788 length:735 start_codon:yes stop_codon:yes gene_type:complete